MAPTAATAATTATKATTIFKNIGPPFQDH
jgi:hypothetical protein